MEINLGLLAFNTRMARGMVSGLGDCLLVCPPFSDHLLYFISLAIFRAELGEGHGIEGGGGGH